MRKIIFFIILMQLTFLFNSLNAAGISGFQSIWFTLKEDDVSTQRWDLYTLSNYAELKVFASPYKDLSLYAKLNNLNYLDEAHIRIKYNLQKVGLETYFFLKQRRFWTDSPLLGITDDNLISENNTNSGIRTNFWNLYQTDGFIVLAHPLYSDNSYQIIRLHRPIGKSTYIGLTYAQKKWAQSEDAYNSITSFDIKSTIHKIYTVFEIAKSKNPSENLAKSDNIAMALELDNIILDLKNYGNFNFRLDYANKGVNYRDYLGNDEYNALTYRLSGHYRFPDKDITYYFYSAASKKKTDGSLRSLDLYNELYVGLINGFSLKFYYKNYYDIFSKINYPDLFTQLEINKKKIWLKMQYKIKDIGTANERYLFGIEGSVTLAPKIKGFFRDAMVTNYEWAQSVFFGQLTYDFGGGVNSYLEYGNGGFASNDLVNDAGFANSSQRTENIVKIGLNVNW